MHERKIAVLLALVATAGMNVHAQDKYPTRPVRIVTATPGGGNDFLARIVAPPLGNAIGQQIIVDNRPSRLVGGIAARSTPDGYTLVVGGSTLQYTPLLERIDYNAITDFTPVSLLERSPNVLVVTPALKVNNVSELVSMARAKPGVLNYGTGAGGASLHLAGELFMIATNTRLVRVPYKATGPAVLGLLTNEVQLVFATAGAVVPLLKDGKLKALGVTTAEPTPLVPHSNDSAARRARLRARNHWFHAGACQDPAADRAAPQPAHREVDATAGCEGAPGGRRIGRDIEFARGARPHHARGRRAHAKAIQAARAVCR